jgi:hypothetical protein
MITAAIAYRIVQGESARTVSITKTILEKHPWYADRWKNDMERLPEAERVEGLFMLAARWADDIRTQAKLQRELRWHYINWPFKPDGEPASVRALPPVPDNILSAIAENERIVRVATDPSKRAVALAWLYHLVGDVHQPLHTVQLFSREYPTGDRGGNEICVRVAPERAPLDLHKLWDGLITSSNNIARLRNIATELLIQFPKSSLPELFRTNPEAWAKESFEIASKIAYQNGALSGTPRGQHRECREVVTATVLPAGYPKMARQIADRRLVLAGYRLANLLMRTVDAH